MRVLEILEKISDVLGYIGAFLIFPLVGIMVYEVGARYLFSAPTTWAFEMSYMLMATMFSFGFAYALKHRSHVNVDFIYDRLGPRAQPVVDLLGYSIFFPTICWIAYAMYEYTVRSYISGEVSGISAWNPVMWPMRMILTLGFAAFALQIFIELVRCIRTILSGAGRET